MKNCLGTGSNGLRMSGPAAAYLPQDKHQARGTTPWRPACGTDSHLLVETGAS